MRGVEFTEFVAARLDEAAATAWSVHDVAKCDALLYEEDLPGAAARTPDCDCGYPARVLREVEAGRKILAEHLPVEFIYGLTCKRCVSWQSAPGEESEFGIAVPDPWPCLPARAVAAPHSDHPEYDPAWAPEPVSV